MSARIRVLLPVHLQTLARTGSEVEVAVCPPITLCAVLDALEASHPVLRGAIREHGTLRRRPFVRYFACQQDLSHAEGGQLLPEAIVQGEEPFVVLGAIAGG